jgi:hypothetical protein
MHASRYVDPCTRTDRIDIQNANWNLQMEHLVNAYLDYRTRGCGDGMPSVSRDEHPCNADNLILQNIELVDIFSNVFLLRRRIVFNNMTGRTCASLQPLPSHKFPNESLIYHGYLGCSPLHPTIAISLCTLAAYRQSHRTCPRFSIQAQCKALCHLHDVRYLIVLSYTNYMLLCRFRTDHISTCSFQMHMMFTLRSCIV